MGANAAHDTTQRTAPQRPPLEIVRDAEAAQTMSPAEARLDTTIADEALVWRAAAIGGAVGFALVAILIAIAGTATGIDPGSAVGIGIFVGIFSGGGFGFMAGAVATLASQTGDHRPISTDHSTGE